MGLSLIAHHNFSVGGVGKLLAYTATDTTTIRLGSGSGYAIYSGGSGPATLSVGTASSDRVVVLSIVAFANVSTIGGLTINGTPVNWAAQVDGTATSFYLGIAYLAVPTGTTVTVESTSYVSYLGIVVGVITGSGATSYSATNAPTTSAGTSMSFSAAVPANGVAILSVITIAVGGITTSWTGAIEDLNYFDSADNENQIAAHGTSSTPSFTAATFTGYGLMATFGP